MTSRFLVACALSVVVTLLPAAHARAESVPAAATAIAHRIVTGSPAEADAAMAEAFGWAGVSTVDGEGKVVAKGVTPTIPITMRSFEMRRAAISARGAPVTNLAEVGEKLFEMGAFAPDEVPMPDFEAAGAEMRRKLESGNAPSDEEVAAAAAQMQAAAEAMTQNLTKAVEGPQGLDAETAGIVFRDILGQMILNGRANPRSPHNFVPLFIEALAKERALHDGVTAADLTTGEMLPEDVELTLTELHLFMLSFLRGRTSWAQAPVRYASLALPILSAPAGGTPCSDFVDKMGDYGKAVPRAAGEAGDAVKDVAGDILGDYVGAGGQKVIGKAASAFRLLTMLIDSAEFELDAAPPVTHWGHQKGNPPEVTLNAKVTLPPPGDKTNAEASDCLNTAFAFDLPASTEAIAKSMADWKVYWALEGLGGHADVSETKNKFKFHGPLGGNLEISGHTGRTKLVLDVREEDLKADRRGKQRKGTMRVSAFLDQSAAIDPTILYTAIKDAPAALIEVLTEWGKKMTAKKATANVKVTWHEPKIFAWEGTVTIETKVGGTRDLIEKTPGRAPPAIAVGASIPTPAGGTEVFHDETSGSRTVTVKVVAGHEGERIHPYTYIAKDHALSTRKESTPEVCSYANGTWGKGTYSHDGLDSVDTDYKGTGWTTVNVHFESDGTYFVEAPIPFASGKFSSAGKYEEKSTCESAPSPDNKPLKTVKIKRTVKNPFKVMVFGKAKADATVLSGSVVENIGEKEGLMGTKGTTTTTWNLKKVVVEWSGE